MSVELIVINCDAAVKTTEDAPLAVNLKPVTSVEVNCKVPALFFIGKDVVLVSVTVTVFKLLPVTWPVASDPIESKTVNVLAVTADVESVLVVASCVIVSISPVLANVVIFVPPTKVAVSPLKIDWFPVSPSNYQDP